MLDDKYISLYTHEAETARLERIIKRLWILAIIIFAALIVTNVAWIYYESQWEAVEETTETVTQDVRSHGNSETVVAGIGDAFNGDTRKADSEEDNDNQYASFFMPKYRNSESQLVAITGWDFFCTKTVRILSLR